MTTGLLLIEPNPVPLRMMTVHQPYATMITRYGKDVENRATRLKWPHAVGIHAGARWLQAGDSDPVVRAAYDPRHAYDLHNVTFGYGDFPVQRVIGLARIDQDVRPPHHASDCADNPCSPWAQPGRWHLHLVDVCAIDPIRARGRQGLWIPDEDLTEAIWAAYQLACLRGAAS